MSVEHGSSARAGQLAPQPGWPIHPLLVACTATIPGYTIVRYLGLAYSFSAHNPGMSATVSVPMGGNRALLEMGEQSIGQAYLGVMQEAANLGANALVGLRFAPTSPTGMMAYGNAAWVQPQ
jgi:uncharacterized protein YbjQ (UPF0145 family)